MRRSPPGPAWPGWRRPWIFPKRPRNWRRRLWTRVWPPRWRAFRRLAATYEAGRLLREGLLAVIAGRPNAGKSSLLNRLLDLDRAIVTEIPGTTRDLIEETITLGGILVRLSDTAGLRPAQDRLEELGIRRTRERLAQADLVLYLVDGSEPCSPEDRAALEELAAAGAWR